jgi:hypothetical protein
VNALGRKAIEVRLIAELRVLAGAKPNMREIRLAIAAELGSCTPAELGGAIQSLRYQGKLHWDRLALSASMIASSEEGTEALPEPEGGAAAAKVTSPPSGPDDEDDEDYPGGVNDVAPEAPVGDHQPRQPEVAGFVPKALLHKAGVHGAQTHAAARPVPAPEHEPEIARLVREDATTATQRRRQARSTGTVRQPIELRKYGVPDMSMSEVIGSMLSDDPKMIMRAVSRKHPAMWRRCILLGRATAKSPMQALYAALETGLDQLEPQEQSNAA